MHNYLEKIINHKEVEVAKLKQQALQYSDGLLNKLYRHDLKRKSNKSFKAALQTKPVAVIAEIKRKSPSKNELAEINDPFILAEQYVAGGAAAISVLTDEVGFNGSLQDLETIAKALPKTPLLRKDFTLDEIQIAEAIICGADAVLLIVAILKDKTKKLLDFCHAKNIDALVEVHTEDELAIALQANAKIIGVNNRNLSTFEVDTNNAKNLIKKIPNNVITVAESGIQSKSLANEYVNLGFNALLIGEALVQSGQPAQFIRDIHASSAIN